MTPCLVPLRTTTDRGDKDDTDADADDTDRRCKMTTFFFFSIDNPTYHTDTQLGHTLTLVCGRCEPRITHPRGGYAASASAHARGARPAARYAVPRLRRGGGILLRELPAAARQHTPAGSSHTVRPASRWPSAGREAYTLPDPLARPASPPHPPPYADAYKPQAAQSPLEARRLRRYH